MIKINTLVFFIEGWHLNSESLNASDLDFIRQLKVKAMNFGHKQDICFKFHQAGHRDKLWKEGGFKMRCVILWWDHLLEVEK